MARRTRIRLLLVTLSTLLLSGCVPAGSVPDDHFAQVPHTEALYDEGLANFRAFRTSVASIQRHLHDAEWIVDQYGAAPHDAMCSGTTPGYTFASRHAAEGVPYDVTQAPDALAQWLRGEGWATAGVSAESAVGSGEAIVVVRASGDPFGKAQHLVVSFYEATQTLLINAESACFDGNASRLHAMIFPEASATVSPVYPESELPGAEPVFRFTIADGTAVDVVDDFFPDQ